MSTNDAESGVRAGECCIPKIPDSGAHSTVYFYALDGVRAFCVFIVILAHTRNRPAILSHFPGFLGVDIFFVLSGFLITYLLRQEYSKIRSINLRAFYLRRFFRIVPIYAVVLLTYVILCRFVGSAEKWTTMKIELPYFLTFMNEYIPRSLAGATPFSYSWTLGIEEKFYLIWPVLFFVMFKSTRLRNAISIGLYFILLAATPFIQGAARSYSGLLVGCFLGILLTGPFAARYSEFMRRVPTIVPLILFIFGFYLAYLQYWLLFLFSWFTFCLVGELVLKETWLSRFLSTRLLVWLGKRSYGMYLIQGLCMDVVHDHLHLDGIICALTTYSLAAVVSEGAYRLIETPARKLGKTLIAGLPLRHEQVVSA